MANTKDSFWHSVRDKVMDGINWIGSGFGAGDWTSYDGQTKHKGWLNSGAAGDVTEAVSDVLGVDNPNSDGDSFISKLLGNNGGSLLNALVGYFSSMAGLSLTGAQREQNEFNAEQAEISRNWQEQMSNTTYQRSVADMQAAHLNPALMYGSAGASAAPSGATASGSSPGAPQLNLMSMLMEYRLKSKQLDIEQQNADTNKQNADTNESAVGAENELKGKQVSWYDRQMEVKVHLDETLANFNEEQAKKVIVERDQIKKNIDLMIKQIEEIDVRELLEKANAEFARASAREIGLMLPYNIALTEAQTDAQQASSFLDWMYHAKERRLLSSDYYDNIIHKSFEDARIAKYNGDASAYQLILHTGAHLKTKASQRLFHGLQTFGEAVSGLGPVFGLATGLGVAKLSQRSANGKRYRQVNYYDSETGGVGTRYVRE